MRSRWWVWISGGILVVAAATFVVISAAVAYIDYRFAQPGPIRLDGSETTIVMLDRGLGLEAISNRLEGAGVITSASIFRLGVWRNRAARELKAGEYAIPAGASMRAILEMLRSGKVLLHRLTIPEGWTTAQALRLVAADPTLVGDVTLSPGEGTLLPDTYLFTRGETRDALIMRMLNAQRDLLSERWPARAPGLPLKSAFEAVVLASIVEKETGVPQERARIAGVFVNRLKKGMRLQSDPTIIYGITQGEPLGRGIRQSEIDRQTPYNTYQISGLPPTPIANPGRAAIEAVLNPAETKELYFVADGTGGHAFAVTAAQHQRNIQQWRAIERAQARSKTPATTN